MTDAESLPTQSTTQSDPLPSNHSNSWQESSLSDVVAGRWSIVVMLLAFLFHWMCLNRHLFWFDECHTYMMIRDGMMQIVPNLKHDVHPPLFFWLAGLSAQTFGIEPWALRLPSAIAAALIVPISYALARRVLPIHLSLFACGMVGFSPILHHHATQARGYAQLCLVVTLACLSLVRLIERPNTVRGLMLVVVTLLVPMTHFVGLFVLPALWLSALVAPVARVKVVVWTTIACMLAGLVTLPFLLPSLKNETGVDWIQPYWLGLPPPAALLRSIDLLGLFGNYPYNSGPLHESGIGLITPAGTWFGVDYQGQQPPSLLAWLSVVLNSGLFGLGTYAIYLRRSISGLVPVGFFVLILAGLFGYSLIRQPIYVLGRNDLMALVGVTIAITASIAHLEQQRTVRWLARLIIVTWIFSHLLANLLWLRTSLADPLSVQYDDCARHIMRFAKPGEPVICLGLCRASIEYPFARAGFKTPIYSFPPSVAVHTGWYDPKKILAQEPDLSEQGKRLVEELKRWALEPSTGLGPASNRRVWVVLSVFDEIDQHFLSSLIISFREDLSNVNQEVPVSCFIVR